MVKFTGMAIGLVLFALFVGLMFTIAGDLGTEYSSNDASEYKNLAGNYTVYVDDGTETNGTLRKIESKLVDSDSSVISTGADLLVAAVDGARLIIGSIATGTKVTDQIVSDSDGVIHPLIGTAIKSIIAIIIIVIIIAMLMRVRPET